MVIKVVFMFFVIFNFCVVVKMIWEELNVFKERSSEVIYLLDNG